MLFVNTSDQSDHHFFKGLLPVTRKGLVANLDKSVL